MRTTYKVKDNEHTYFITSTIVNWIPVFKNKQNLDALIESMVYSQKYKQLKIFGYVIMPEHFHMICACDKLVSTIQSIKSFTAKRIIETFDNENDWKLLNQFIESKKEYKNKSKYQVWQEGYKPKAILTDRMFGQKINYIHYNPVKRGLAEKIEEYDLSSAGDYYLRKPGRILIDGLNYSL
jgi:putative transposase